jgi:DNA polymerase IV
VKGYRGRTIGVKLRYDDFRTLTRDKTLIRHTADPRDILAAARECLKRVPLDRKLRLLGIRVSSLACEEAARAGADAVSGPALGETLSMFD